MTYGFRETGGTTRFQATAHNRIELAPQVGGKAGDGPPLRERGELLGTLKGLALLRRRIIGLQSVPSARHPWEEVVVIRS